jgi:uncharacterized protein
MSERDSYKPGEFCWVDLASADFEASKKFYADLIGWEWEEAGPADETGGYGFFTYKGKQVCGGGPVQAPGQPSAWSSYVKVEDADASTAKVEEAGGTVIAPPFELPQESGRMAVCQDPGGAFFSVTQQRRHSGAELVNEIGCWTWCNLLTRDLEGMERFYGDVFGWETAKNEEAPEGILNWQMEGQRWPEGLGGLMQIPDEFPAEVPSYWEVYFLVEDLDRGMETIKSAGGQIMAGPIEIPVGRIAAGPDPQGAWVALMEPDYPEPR